MVLQGDGQVHGVPLRLAHGTRSSPRIGVELGTYFIRVGVWEYRFDVYYDRLSTVVVHRLEGAARRRFYTLQSKSWFGGAGRGLVLVAADGVGWMGMGSRRARGGGRTAGLRGDMD